MRLRLRSIAVLAFVVGVGVVTWSSLVRVTAQGAATGQGFLCTVINNAGTTLTAFNGSCIAAPGQALFITDITASATTIATTTTDQYLSLKYGTGTNCGTGTTTVWSAYNLAFAPTSTNLVKPIRVPANNDLCWMDAVAGSKTFIVSGFYGL